ncbi:MAG TPA: AAA family ATPase [candidate division Zixibacteria bacterium]|nr:AAA family ATPase [candidate division Zixibacteria bacterium]
MIEALRPQDHPSRFGEYFGFKEVPFGVTPDPRFFYSNAAYVEALSALARGVEGRRGLMLLTGEVGTGKTILLRTLMRRLESTVRFVFISTTHLTSLGLVELALQDLGLAPKEKNRLEMLRELEAYLKEELGRGRTVALLLDEAQNLTDDALEGMCALLNLETEAEKLLQVVLVGQPELAARLAKPALRRIKQRIAIHHRLFGLQGAGEVEDYIRHRLRVAGYEGPDLFNKEAIEAVWCYSGGTPRLVNMLCDNALAMSCEGGKRKVSPYLVMKAANGLLLDRGADAPKPLSSDPGTARGRPAARVNGRKAEAAEGRRADRIEAAGDDGAAARPAPEGRGPVVAADFIDQLTRSATEAMGPMAALVVRDQISALGESGETFPQVKLGKLIERVSEEILNQTMREGFRRKMQQKLATLKTL